MRLAFDNPDLPLFAVNDLANIEIWGVVRLLPRLRFITSRDGPDRSDNSHAGVVSHPSPRKAALFLQGVEQVVAEHLATLTCRAGREIRWHCAGANRVGEFPSL